MHVNLPDPDHSVHVFWLQILTYLLSGTKGSFLSAWLPLTAGQILAKRPGLEDGTFAWHQDMAYWPPFTASQETATCWLALDDSTVENGCMRFLPGSHEEAELRPHRPVASQGRDESHALFTHVDEASEALGVHYVEIARGDITVHNERIVHGSGPNKSSRWRRAYVVAYRRSDCIAEERSLGFTHSHNDVNSWDQFHEHK